MLPENFAKIFFGRALNRPRSPEVRKPLACFLVLFARRKKNKTALPCREFRGSANLESARRNGGFALTKLKPSQREIRGSTNLELAHPNYKAAQTKLNPFAAAGDLFLLFVKYKK